MRNQCSFARSRSLRHWQLALLIVCVLPGCGGSGVTGPIGLQSPPPMSSNIMRISSDPFTNISSQHQTQVEPSIFASGLTVVSAFQSGRFTSAGASDIGFATSRDAGVTWTAGFLPGTTRAVNPSNPFDSVSDPVVAFDAAHSTWLIASLPITLISGGSLGHGVLVSRSVDGINWGNPVQVAGLDTATDKNWIACDDTASSPFYGHCYLEWDDGGTNGLIFMSTSMDGGATWTNIVSPSGNPAGIGGQPLVQANGTVIVPIDDFNETTVLSFVSHDGGTSWTAPVVVSPVNLHVEAAGLRSGPLPSAAIDASGKVYVVWEDCSFRAGCTTNDLVFSTSLSGTSWTPVSRIPIDPTSSSVDHFIPGIGIQPGTSGGNAHIALTYYYYSDTNCTPSTCQLYVGFIASQDGGATWGAPTQLAGPMRVAWLPQTLLGPMVGDYIATAFAGAAPVGVFAVAHPPTAGIFDEATYVPRPGTLMVRSVERRSSSMDRRISGVQSQYPRRHQPHRTP